MGDMEYTIILESFTIDEGGDFSRFRKVITAAVSFVQEDKRGEILVVDSCRLPELAVILAEFPEARIVDAVGMGYDGGKMKAAREASGRYILFLDGDCVPDLHWKSVFLEALRKGEAVAFGGYTRYEGGFLAAVHSVMDFGFLYPCVTRPLQCYAFNNCAFLREALLALPAGGRKLRCACYHHAQQFLRNGTPVMMVPTAEVLHERQPVVRERTRQGYDVVAACWEDPDLPAARWLRFRILSVPFYYVMSVWLDWRRAWTARTALKQTWLTWWLAFFLFPVLRLMDVAGMVQAFVHGQREGGWGGNFLEQRSALRGKKGSAA